MHFKTIYKAPFHSDKYGPYIWSENGKMSLMFTREFPRLSREDVVEALNGTKKIKGSPEWSLKDVTDIYHKDVHIMTVRGWGALTGVGGMNLKEEQAAEIQDAFAAWVIETLNKLTGIV